MLSSFHLVFDEVFQGSTRVYTPPEMNWLLGAADALSIRASASEVVGTAPTLTVQVEHSADETRWSNRNGTAEINAASLSASADKVLAGNHGDPAGTPRLGFVRLRIQLGGTKPRAIVKLSVTGRGEPLDMGGGT